MCSYLLVIFFSRRFLLSLLTFYCFLSFWFNFSLAIDDFFGVVLSLSIGYDSVFGIGGGVLNVSGGGYVSRGCSGYGGFCVSRVGGDGGGVKSLCEWGGWWSLKCYWRCWC